MECSQHWALCSESSQLNPSATGQTFGQSVIPQCLVPLELARVLAMDSNVCGK